MLTKKDLLIFLGIFFLAALIRLPFLSHPSESIFDEHYWRITTSNVHNGNPFFDVHPPLSTLIWESAVHQKTFSLVKHGGNKIRVPFGDFPYYNLRFFMAILGSLLPAIIFIIARLISLEDPLAILPAIFIIFDNALIIYSRSVLPDTMLLFFGFLGFALWLLSKQIKNNYMSWIVFCLATILFGASISIKWTGLGFLGTAVLYEIYNKNIKRVVFGAICASIVYLLVFAVFFARLSGAHIETVYKIEALNSVNFSAEKNLKNFSQFLMQYHKAMTEGNNSYDKNFGKDGHPTASKPYQWPFNQKTINFWVNHDTNVGVGVNPDTNVGVGMNQDSSAGIVLAGNFPAWILGIISALMLIIFAIMQKTGYSIPIVINAPVYLLLSGFLINYAPLFFIGRSLFLYHYFSALIFSYLLIPFALSFWVKLLPSPMEIKRLSKILIIIVVLWYAVFIPRIYGVPSPFGSIQNDIKSDTIAETQIQ